MSSDELKDFIESLEQEYNEQSRAIWFDNDKKYDTLHAYETALQSLKEIAYLQYDEVIE